MQYQSDYVLRLIEQMGGLVRRALERLGQGGAEESYEYAEEAIDMALDLERGLASKLAPQSLASLLEMRNLDDRVIVLVADALEVQGEVLESSGELVSAGVRRDQAIAVRALLNPERAN